MPAQRLLKELLQLCADVQDAFWEGASRADGDQLAPVLQGAAVQWNAFADKLFQVLLEVDHTNPESRWKANPHRKWMNPQADEQDDRRICHECLHGLELAGAQLHRASSAQDPRVRRAVVDQLSAVNDQMTALHQIASDADRRRAV